MAEQAPPPDILAAFGLAADPAAPVQGGQGDTFRAGTLALKRCHDPEQTEWVSAILETLEERGFRVARPVRSQACGFVVRGWCATCWLDGTVKVEGRWLEAIAALDAFHAAVRKVGDAAVLHRADNPWSRADALVWSSDRPEHSIGPTADRLFELRRPVELRAQLIQGDPSEGNILFTPGLAPALIDIAPYWHPADYSIALLVADGIAWSQAPARLLDVVAGRAEMRQLLLRAVLFRLYVGYLFRGGIDAAEKRAAAYAPVIAFIEG
jgi:uncharacterized protein (TIGR02569 family)